MALRQAEAGTPVREICRKLRVSEQMIYRWKRKYAGLGLSELWELKQLKEESRRLKRVAADLTLDKDIPVAPWAARAGRVACEQPEAGVPVVSGGRAGPQAQTPEAKEAA